MDKEMRDYLDQKLLVLATKDDVEKLRQESKANLRQLREEIDLIREETKEGLQKVRSEIQSTYDQTNRAIDLSLQRFREEGAVQVIQRREEFKADIGTVRGGMDRLQQQVKQVAEEFAALDGKIKEGFTEVKEELGSMIKFSYADLEKRFNALEARVKSLEKMVLP
jgi:uncharacterized protein YdhG (YjbR/CyaY superfamily)